MRLTVLAVLLLPLAVFAEPTADSSDPAATVKGYFAALGKNDFKRALALTSGTAQTRTEKMMGTLKQQAAAAHAKVELRVKRVLVSPPAGQLADGLPVSVEV